MKFPVKLPDRGFTILRYRTNPSELLRYLGDFKEGSQFQMSLTYLSYRGKVKSYIVDEKIKKITVSFEWLCIKDNSTMYEWTSVPPQDFELNFVRFYLQAEDRIKIWTKRAQVVGYFYKPNDPTNIKQT